MRNLLKRVSAGVILIGLCAVQHAGAQLSDEQRRIDEEIQQTWQQFLEAIGRNDAVGAADFFTPGARQRYLDAFLGYGESLHGIDDGWSGIKAVNLSIPFSEYSVFDGQGDDRLMFFITFTRTDDGFWQIQSM